MPVVWHVTLCYNAAVKSATLVGWFGIWFILSPRVAHKFSMGLRSEDLAGQSIIWIIAVCKNSVQTQAVWGWTLCCWLKHHLHTNLSHLCMHQPSIHLVTTKSFHINRLFAMRTDFHLSLVSCSFSPVCVSGNVCPTLGELFYGQVSVLTSIV